MDCPESVEVEVYSVVWCNRCGDVFRCDTEGAAYAEVSNHYHWHEERGELL